jgi:hypothetical protein
MRRLLGVDPGVNGGLAVVEITDATAPVVIESIDIPVVRRNHADPLVLLPWSTWATLLERVRR